MMPALRTTDLGKRYSRSWALRNCTLALPPGRVAALVGPNGAGKTTLLHLSVGLTKPNEGSVEVFGVPPRAQPTMVLPRLGFLAQDRPLYKSFSVAEMLKVGSRLNPRWDDGLAKGRMKKLGIPLEKKVGQLSGGQQAQVALVMSLAKRPELLLLDEPINALDPLARREFLQTLMEAVAEDGLTILLSSHIIADLERVCDYLIILSAGRVQLAGDVEYLLQKHKLLIGARCDADAVASVHNVVQTSHTERQTSLLVRLNGHIFDSSWEVHSVPLEEIVLGYLGRVPDGPPVVLEPSEEEVPA